MRSCSVMVHVSRAVTDRNSREKSVVSSIRMQNTYYSKLSKKLNVFEMNARHGKI